MANEGETASARWSPKAAVWCALMVGLGACHDGESVRLADAGALLDAQLDAQNVDASPAGSLDAARDASDAATQPNNDAELAPDAYIPDPVQPSVKQLVLGRAHGCSLDPAISGLLCWGDNRHGQTTVPSLSSPSVVAAGGDVSCAIDSAGVKCWGDDTHGQLGVPASLGKARQLAVGDAHACAVTDTGAVRCWGDDAYGQLRVPALAEVTAIGAGVRHSCALTQGGVTCWGDDTQGQSHAPALEGPVQLAVGGFHSCALAKGGVTCWGAPPVLQTMPTLRSPTFVAAGRSHSCALDSTGVNCWGDLTVAALTPRELTNVKQLAVGGTEGLAHACARHQQGVACWGDNSLGQTAYDGRPLHVLYRAQADIAAPPAAVWDVLMDLQDYGLWNPFTIAMKSSLKIGDPMVMTVKMSDLVTLEQTETIRVLDGRKACWGIDTTSPEVNSGERCQWLEPLPNGGTRYVTEDLIEGTLNSVAIGLFGENTRMGFEGVARELKKRVESLQGP